MKKLHWLVIVLACSSPPCLWTACEQADEQESYETVQDCGEFYQALLNEWTICSDGDEQIKKNLSNMQQWCETTVKSVNIPISVYNECIDVGIGCDMSTGHVIIIEPCLIVINAE
jgi:hypothetical protein